MWNLSESDKRHYDRQALINKKKNKALNLAKARGDAFKKWLEDGNVLTKETQPEFNALMKLTNKLNKQTCDK